MTKHSFKRRALRAAAATGIALSVLAPSAAFAADYPNGGTGDPGAVEANTATNSSSSGSSTLPFTGGDVLGMAMIGAGTAGAGLVMVRRSRKKK